jgi:hypothetical protein
MFLGVNANDILPARRYAVLLTSTTAVLIEQARHARRQRAKRLPLPQRLFATLLGQQCTTQETSAIGIHQRHAAPGLLAAPEGVFHQRLCV